MISQRTKDWIVTARCTIIKEIIVSNCTKEQAMQDPWEYATDETETDQENYFVLKVEPNE